MFQTAISRDPKWALPYRNLALTEISLHDNDAAVAALQNGIKSASTPEVLDTELASMYVRQGKTEDAVSVYETQLKRNPKSDVMANNLAMLLVTYKKDSMSLDRAKELTARFSNSSNADFLDTYGWVLYKRGEGPAAVAALQSALAKTPNSPVSLYHVGMAEVLVGQSDAARDHLSRSLASGKNFAEMDQAKAALDNLAKVTPLAAASPTT
jgi:Tfp pilus assembly protein PilF